MRKDTTIFSELQEFFQQNDAHKAINRISNVMSPTSRRDEFYYRIKESFRDLTGRVCSRIMLNVGFINEDHQPEDIRDIGKCLTYLHEHQGESDLFGSPPVALQRVRSA